MKLSCNICLRLFLFHSLISFHLRCYMHYTCLLFLSANVLRDDAAGRWNAMTALFLGCKRVPSLSLIVFCKVQSIGNSFKIACRAWRWCLDIIHSWNSINSPMNFFAKTTMEVDVVLTEIDAKYSFFLSKTAVNFCRRSLLWFWKFSRLDFQIAFFCAAPL